MPRRKRTKKEGERFLIREAAQAMGYRVVRMCGCERPDAIVVLERNGIRKRVGIEHTGYYHDASPGSASLANLKEFWDLVQSSIVRRVCRDARLRRVDAKVSLRSPKAQLLRKRRDLAKLARDLAAELVALARATDCRDRYVNVRRFLPLYPLVGQYVQEVTLKEWPHGIGSPRQNWRCSNIRASSVSLKIGHIVKAIQDKDDKAKGYNWRGAQEKWLLIVADGETTQAVAGPESQAWKWNDAVLRSVCNTSVFDRIVFIERAARWYKELKPESQVVRFG